MTFNFKKLLKIFTDSGSLVQWNLIFNKSWKCPLLPLSHQSIDSWIVNLHEQILTLHNQLLFEKFEVEHSPRTEHYFIILTEGDSTQIPLPLKQKSLRNMEGSRQAAHISADEVSYFDGPVSRLFSSSSESNIDDQYLGWVQRSEHDWPISQQAANDLMLKYETRH